MTASHSKSLSGRRAAELFARAYRRFAVLGRWGAKLPGLRSMGVSLLSKTLVPLSRDPHTSALRILSGPLRGRKILCDTGWSLHYALGVYEYPLSRVIERLLSAGDVAIDVGANCGYHAMLMASIAGPTGRVYAFEPHLLTFEQLSKTIAMNTFTNVELVNTAVSDAAGEADFCFLATPGDPLACLADGRGSLARIQGREAHNVRTTTVPVVSLDEHLPAADRERLSLVKIDVEGAEIAVLEGMRKLLKSSAPAVIVELSGPEHIDAGTRLLQHHRFQVLTLERWTVTTADGEQQPAVNIVGLREDDARLKHVRSLQAVRMEANRE